MSDDQRALMELLLVSKPGAAHVVQHYMYFVSKSAAAEAASAIRKLGFVADVRLSAEGDKYLVLVQHVVVPTEENIAAARKVMEDHARVHRGEYDGWEARVER